jgi:outer membrane receptor for ferrienterochelin and colicins
MSTVDNYHSAGSLILLLGSLSWSVPLAGEEEHIHKIEEVIVTSMRNRLSFEQQPTRIEVLGQEEVQEKANMKPGDIRMLLNEITGIHVQQTSATTFSSSIRMQGLDGKYTQLLRNGMPLFGGFSSGLGLLQIAPLDLQQVEVIKGANSTLYGAGAIAGLVNLITKKPQRDPETSLLVNLTSAGGMDVSAFHSSSHDQKGVTIFSSYNKGDAYDPADNGFTAIPKFNRWTFNPTLFFSKPTSEMSVGFSAIKENRIGGDMSYIAGEKAQPSYFEQVETDRLSSQFEYITEKDQGRELIIKNSLNYYQQTIGSSNYTFKGSQFSSFSELHLRGSTSRVDWVVGMNLWTDSFEQDIPKQPTTMDFNSQTAGFFAQGALAFNESWSLDTGLRIDSTSDYGDFFLPRVSLMYTADSQTSIRIGGGLGYKVPSPFSADASNLHYRDILSIDPTELSAEESSGLNIDLNKRFSIGSDATINANLLFFYTQVDSPLRLLANDDGTFAYSQPDNYVNSQGSEISLIWRWNNFKYFFGYTYADVKTHNEAGSTVVPLMPKNRVNNILVYEVEDELRIGLEAYYYGRQILADGYETRDFWIFGLMMEKTMDEHFSVFLNFENFSDTRQSRYDPIYSGSQTSPEFADIYAPLDGFVINGGVKIVF